MPEQIVVEAKLPPSPLILADVGFLLELTKTEATVAALAINDPASAQQAADILRVITKAGSDLESKRTELKKPFLEVSRLIDETARKASLRITSLKDKVKRGLADYTAQVEAREAAERRKRDEEIARLRREEDERLADEKRKADALAAQNAAPAVEEIDINLFDTPPPIEKSERQKQIDRLTYATSLARPAAPTGITYRTTLKFVISDVHALPTDFVIRTANERLIRDTFCAGYKEGQPLPIVPGITFSVDKQPVSTGR